MELADGQVYISLCIQIDCLGMRLYGGVLKMNSVHWDTIL